MHLPFLAGPHRLSMGLKALDPDEWIEIDDRFADDLARRRRLLAERHDEVVGALPGSEPGQREVLDLLLDHLPRRFPDRFEVADGRVRNRVTGESFAVDRGEAGTAPLEVAGRLVQEDLCLMRSGPEGYALVAAVLCFPSHWRLRDKLGRPLAAIHAPVPGYAHRLAGTVDRLFAQIRAERPVWRLNWSLADTPELFLPERRRNRGSDPAITASNAGERLWLRVERQTLRRLPRSGDVLFTIRTHVTPLAEVAAVPGAAAALAARVDEMPPDLAAYKGIPPVRDALVGYLAASARGAGAG